MCQPRDLRHRHDGRELHQKTRLGLVGGGALALSLLGSALAAQDYPALYEVTGVAANDVLNIRAEPDGESDILGELAFDRTRVEVLELSADGRWAKVGNGESNGWVATRFLSAMPVIAETNYPLRCIGTEPFWSVNWDGNSARYSTPEEERSFTLITETQARNGVSARFSDEEGTEWQILAQRMQCSDGMSDRMYGMRMLMLGAGSPEAGGGPEIYAGCCTYDGG